MTELSSQELAELERQFATDPTSSAYIPLTRAYLAQNRHMEAMVVCRKGVKSQPDNVEGRVLLGRVYAEQGKVPKALDEVKGVLAQFPDNADAHFFLGQLHERSGRFDEAVESFKEALRKQRGHAEATAALKAKGIDWSPGPSPEEIAAEEARVKAAAEAEAAQKAALAQAAAVAKARATGAAIQGGGPATPATGNPAPGGFPRRTATTSMPPAMAAQLEQMSTAGGYGLAMTAGSSTNPAKRLSFGFTFGLGALLLLVVTGLVVGLKVASKNAEEIKTHLKAAQSLTKTGTTRDYRKALGELQAALKIDDSQDLAVGQYAYVLASLVDRGDKEYDAKAKEAVARAEKVAKNHPLSVAAQMVALRMAGDAAGALKLVEGQDPNTLSFPVKAELLRTYAAVGNIAELQKMAGVAKDSTDALLLLSTSEAYRRLGERFRTRNAVDGALKYEMDNDAARALRALIILEADDITNLDVAIDDVRVLMDLGKDAGPKQRGYAWLARALIRMQTGGDEREIKVDLDAARQALGKDPEVPFFDAKIALRNKDAALAMKLAEEAVKLDRFRIAPYLLWVEAATDKKDWATADKVLADAKAVFGNNLELGLQRGIRLREEGKFDEGIAALNELKGTHDVAEVYRDLGKVYMRKGDNAQAIEVMKKGAEKAGSRGPATQANVYMWLGRALAAADNHEGAIEAFSQALAATSQYAVTYFFLGVSMEKVNNPAAAKEAYSKYLAAEPKGNYANSARERASAL